MKTRGKIYIILTALALLAIVVLEYTKPKPVNWFPSYAKEHKIPFGTYVFHEQLERVFSKENITAINRPPYETLSKDSTLKGTYVFINNQVNFGDTELNKLLDWTASGNTLFIASSNFESQLLDTLQLNTSVISTLDNLESQYQLQLKNKQLDKRIYTFDKANTVYYFNEIDTLNTKVIGVIDNINDKTLLEKEHINTIKQPFGDGEIILSTFPQAFTNYFILKSPNHNYTKGLFSYLDGNQQIYLDSHYKSGKSFFSSPLYILLNTKELKWAYYLMLIGVFIYILFEGKRKQRAIPIIKPLRNQTLNFTRTIANMYYEKGKHHEIALHKIQHFLEYIRTHLHLNTTKIDDEFIKNLASRSNNTIEDTQHLFNSIERIKTNKQLDSKALETLNALIETFKSNNTWKTKT